MTLNLFCGGVGGAVGRPARYWLACEQRGCSAQVFLGHAYHQQRHRII